MGAGRSRGRCGPILVVLAIVLGDAATAEAAVKLSPDQQRRLGVGVQALAARRHSLQVAAFAKVLDPGPLAALESDLTAAAAAAAASSREAARARALSQNGAAMAAKDAEAAIAQARADQSKLALLRRRVGLEWGPGLQRLTDARRAVLINAISAGRAALVQVDTPDSEGQAGARTVEIDIGSTTVHAAVIGPSRTAEPRLQSSGLICLVAGPQAVLFSVGLTQSARINQPTSESGVVLPRGAVVRSEGSDWAYVRTGPAAFERRQIQDPIPEADGYFVGHGFAPGDVVAVQGVAALFAADQAAARRGDE